MKSRKGNSSYSPNMWNRITTRFMVAPEAAFLSRARSWLLGGVLLFFHLLLCDLKRERAGGHGCTNDSWSRWMAWFVAHLRATIKLFHRPLARALKSRRYTEKKATGNRQKPGDHVSHAWASFQSGCHHLSYYLYLHFTYNPHDYQTIPQIGMSGIINVQRRHSTLVWSASWSRRTSQLRLFFFGSSHLHFKKISQDVFTRLSFI